MTKFFISPGDPAGIGPEVTLKALSKNKKIQNNFILAGDKNFYEDLISLNNLDINLIEEDSDDEGVIFKHFPLKNNVSIGNPDVGNANYIIDILSRGALGCLKNEFKGLITGPINKELINQSGFEFSGHTEFLADISNVKKVVMLLMNDKLKIALLTTHIPLSEVPSKISKKIWKIPFPLFLMSLKILGKLKIRLSVFWGLIHMPAKEGLLVMRKKKY